MKKWIVGCVIIIQCFVLRVSAQESYTERANNYVLQYGKMAIREQVKNGIPAAITLAQGILETEAGNSELATQANNHFGIKCKSDWTGQTFTHTDDKPDECFRKYNSAEESYNDHSIYLSTTPRYADLFKLPVTDYKSWAKGLKRCGYATSPTYAQRLIKIIEDFHLQDYTYAAVNKKSDVDNAIANATNTPPSSTTEKKEVIVQQEATADEQNYTNGQQVKVNGLKAIYLFKGEGLLKYAIQYGVRYEHLLDINDLPDAPLSANMFVYLEKKKYRGAHPTHIVKEGENLHLISQQEGIQLRRLMMLNRILKVGDEPVPGIVLELQKMSESRPVFVSDNNVIVKKNNTSTTSTAKKSDYIYKQTLSTSITTDTPAAPTKTNTSNAKIMTAYVQNGDKIEKIELNDHPSTTTASVATTTTEIITPIVNNESTKVVTTTPVTVETPNTTLNTATTTTAVNNQQEQKIKEDEDDTTTDPLVLLKRKLDKVVYADDNKKEATTQNTDTATVAPPISGPVVNDVPVADDKENATIQLGKNKIKYYTVKKGETAFTIARKHNISLAQLKEWNNLEDAQVKVGQQLRVKK